MEYLRRKAKAEAVTAEEMPPRTCKDMYQQMLEDAARTAANRWRNLRADRDHYKQERNELRDKMEQHARSWTGASKA